MYLVLQFFHFLSNADIYNVLGSIIRFICIVYMTVYCIKSVEVNLKAVCKDRDYLLLFDLLAIFQRSS